MPWKPNDDDLEILRGQNPWHAEGAVPVTLAPEGRRSMAAHLWHALMAPESGRFQVVLGPRRVGKTTVLYQTVAELLRRGVPASRIHWLRLDHPRLLEVPLGDLVRFLADQLGATATNPAYVMLDELTYAERFDLWLKTFHDERWPVRIAATSSSSAALREARVESGVGRWEEQYLPPWTFDEYRRWNGDAPAFELHDSLDASLRANLGVAMADQRLERRRYLLLGGFPELLLKDDRGDEVSAVLDSQRILRNDAVQNAIFRDLPQAYGVHEPFKLERLLYLLAGQVGGIVSPAKLATELQLSTPTVERYVGYLERAFTLFLVPNFASAEESVQRRGRRAYFCDGAVRNAALHRGLLPLRDPNEMAKLVENSVATHLHALMQLGEGRLHYWRDGKHEVDFVFQERAEAIAFEVTLSASHARAGLDALMQRHPRLRGRCWIVSPELPAMAPSAMNDGIGTLPLDLFLRVTGAQIDAVLRRRIGDRSALR